MLYVFYTNLYHSEKKINICTSRNLFRDISQSRTSQFAGQLSKSKLKVSIFPTQGQVKNILTDHSQISPNAMLCFCSKSMNIKSYQICSWTKIDYNRSCLSLICRNYPKSSEPILFILQQKNINHPKWQFYRKSFKSNTM